MLPLSGKGKRYNGQWKSQKIATSTGLRPLGAFCPAPIDTHHRSVCVHIRYLSLHSCNWCSHAGMKRQRAKSTWHVRRIREIPRALLYTVSKTDSDTSWEENAMKKRERCKDKKKRGFRRKAKEQTGTQSKARRESREEPALNSQIIENAVSVSAHNVYRSRATFWHKTCVLSNCSQKLS